MSLVKGISRLQLACGRDWKGFAALWCSCHCFLYHLKPWKKMQRKSMGVWTLRNGGVGEQWSESVMISVFIQLILILNFIRFDWQGTVQVSVSNEDAHLPQGVFSYLGEALRSAGSLQVQIRPKPELRLGLAQNTRDPRTLPIVQMLKWVMIQCRQFSGSFVTIETSSLMFRVALHQGGKWSNKQYLLLVKMLET